MSILEFAVWPLDTGHVYAQVYLRVMLAFALAVAGGIASALAGVSHRRLCNLISLAAGTLLGAALFSILPEAAEALDPWELVPAFASGYGLFFLISKYVFHVCPACAASHFDDAAAHRFGEIATAMVIALAVHCSLDGVALAAGNEVSRRLDASMALAVCVHKFPEGLALGALLLGAGFPTLRAVTWVAAVESTTLVGGTLGLWVLPSVTPVWLNLVLAHLGGGFLYLAFHAVVGELAKHSKKVVLVNFSLGVVLIALLNLALWML
jgi:zinc and cadmium transporter